MTRPAEEHWRKSHGPEWLADYANSSFGPMRAPLGAALKRVAPFKTALDLGCNCGVLVPWLGAASPDVTVFGIDVNYDAVAAATSSWPRHRWFCGSVVDELGALVDGGLSFDVVVSSSCLEHIAPTDIDQVLTHMAAIAAKAIVLQEVSITVTQPAGRTPLSVMEWRHDYVGKLSERGWTCRDLTWLPGDDALQRTGSVMTFTRS